jgi:hypothetical protein
MNPGNIKVLITVILVLLVLYFILRIRTENIRRRRDGQKSRFRKNR